jgi:hypothetical protein
MEQKRSLFGPLLLIATGVIWLLIQSGNISTGNLWALTHVWPFLLIAAGVGLILKPYGEFISWILDVIIVGGAVLAIIFAPKLGWDNPSMFSLFDGNGSFISLGVRGSGNIVTETREVEDFQSINVEYPVTVLITQGGAESVKVEADDNFLPGLRTQVKNSTLEIFYQKTDDRRINPTKPVIVTITVKDLNKIDFPSAGEIIIEGLETKNLDVAISGAGKLELNDIHTESLSVRLSGAGSIAASGTTDDLEVNISGFGNFKAGDLHGKTANVVISGAGNATVWVDDELNAQISGAGSVNYYGTAKVTKQISGLGNVRHEGNK